MSRGEEGGHDKFVNNLTQLICNFGFVFVNTQVQKLWKGNLIKWNMINVWFWTCRHGQASHKPQYISFILSIISYWILSTIHLHLVVAQPIGVLHVIDSVAVVIEIVHVRDPVVVVVHINWTLGVSNWWTDGNMHFLMNGNAIFHCSFILVDKFWQIIVDKTIRNSTKASYFISFLFAKTLVYC